LIVWLRFLKNISNKFGISKHIVVRAIADITGFGRVVVEGMVVSWEGSLHEIVDRKHPHFFLGDAMSLFVPTNALI
jgi:hypothetical protein